MQQGNKTTQVSPQTLSAPVTRKPRVLFADDNKSLLFRLNQQLQGLNIEVSNAVTKKEAVHRARGCDLVVLDMDFEDLESQEHDRHGGLAILKALKQDPATKAIPVVFLAREMSEGDKKRAIELGAVACLDKVDTAEGMKAVVKAALDIAHIAVQKDASEGAMLNTIASYIQSQSFAMKEIYRDFLRAQRRLSNELPPPNVLIYGETGTGKELVAKAISALTPYTCCLVSKNVAELKNEALLAGLLFGREKVSITWLHRTSQGFLRQRVVGFCFLMR